MRLTLRDWVTTALFAAIIAVLAQVTIPLPFSPVPITGQTFAVGLSATILGSKKSVIAVALYLLMGGVGLPVFSGFSGGLGVVAGPDGGYLFSFIIAAYFIGLYLEKTDFTLKHALIANLIAMLITLTIGSAWLKVALSLSWQTAFVVGALPFLLVGIIKAILSASIGLKIRERLLSSGTKL